MLKVGDIIRFHGIVTQFAFGNQTISALGYANRTLLAVIRKYRKRDIDHILAGPDEHGNTYEGVERQAEPLTEIEKALYL